MYAVTYTLSESKEVTIAFIRFDTRYIARQFREIIKIKKFLRSGLKVSQFHNALAALHQFYLCRTYDFVTLRGRCQKKGNMFQFGRPPHPPFFTRQNKAQMQPV